MSELDLSKTQVLITGADKVLGKAVATVFSKAGASLILTGRDIEKVGLLDEALAKSATPDKIQAFAADLASLSTVGGLIHKIQEHDLHPTVFIHADVFSPCTKVCDLDPDAITKALNVNCLAPLQIVRALLPDMRQKGGIVISFTSSLSERLITTNAALASAQNAWKTLLRTLALEERQNHVRTYIAQTSCLEGVQNSIFAGSEELKKELTWQGLLPCATIDDIAGMALALAKGPDSLSGTTVSLDNGITDLL